MKKLTKEKLLNSTLKELGFDIDGNLIEYEKFGHRPIQIEVGKIDIELIPEPPEVNIKNLGRFMCKYGGSDNPYPEALFNDGGKTVSSTLISVYGRGFSTCFVAKNKGCFGNCQITDPRWADMEVE